MMWLKRKFEKGTNGYEIERKDPTNQTWDCFDDNDVCLGFVFGTPGAIKAAVRHDYASGFSFRCVHSKAGVIHSTIEEARLAIERKIKAGGQ